MFTGIIQAVGSVDRLNIMSEGLKLAVQTPDALMATVKLGDSIAVNGVCLTAMAINDQGFEADVSNETLEKTTFAELTQGQNVNLELALKVGDPLGGHWVSGHVDDTAEIVEISVQGFSHHVKVEVADQWQAFIAPKGSVSLDGVSLTVNERCGNVLQLNLVPHTLAATTLSAWSKGQKINLEIDTLARYMVNHQRSNHHYD